MDRNQWWVPVGLLATVTLVIVGSTGVSQPPAAKRKTVFSTLKVGQAVTLKEKGSAWEIGTVGEIGLLSHKVTEIGDDFIVLRDGAGIVETRIPVTAVRAVTHVALGRK